MEGSGCGHTRALQQNPSKHNRRQPKSIFGNPNSSGESSENAEVSSEKAVRQSGRERKGQTLERLQSKPEASAAPIPASNDLVTTKTQKPKRKSKCFQNTKSQDAKLDDAKVKDANLNGPKPDGHSQKHAGLTATTSIEAKSHDRPLNSTRAKHRRPTRTKLAGPDLRDAELKQEDTTNGASIEKKSGPAGRKHGRTTRAKSGATRTSSTHTKRSAKAMSAVDSQVFGASPVLPLDDNPKVQESWPYREVVDTALARTESTSVVSDIKIKLVRPHGKTFRKRTSFLSLPRELRDLIYEESIDLAGITENFKNEQMGFYGGIATINTQKRPDKVRRLMQQLEMRHGQLKTPTILLINRQIHKEALEVLRSRTILFSNPSINHKEIFPLSHLVSPGLVRNVKSLHFQMSMKQHTEETMAGELHYGSNWFRHGDTESNESLDYAQPWSYFFVDLLPMLTAPGPRIQQLNFSIMTGSLGSKHFTVTGTEKFLSSLHATILRCEKSRNLETFVNFLEDSQRKSQKQKS